MNIPSPYEMHKRFLEIYQESVIAANIKVPFDSLDNGRRILSSESECTQYLALYGGRHYHKLSQAYASTKFERIGDKTVEIIDWGCGQALATCVLVDYLIDKG